MAATKYAFAQGLKELRFLFCHTSEQSSGTRYAMLCYVMLIGFT